MTGDLQQIPRNKEVSKENSISEIDSKSSTKSLSLRPDVMNKNIFRALRRECKTLFSKFSKSKKNFIPNLYKFSEGLLASTEIDWQSLKDFKRDEFTKYLGVLISYCGMKKTFEDERDVQKLNDTNALLYKYSHRIFNTYILTPEIRIIIQIIYERVGISEVIANNVTLLANAEAYKERMQKLLEKVSNPEDIDNILFE